MIRFACEKDKVKEIKAAIETNDGYCPCKIEKTPDTKCMCLEFREMKEGTCHCGLYQKIQSCH